MGQQINSAEENLLYAAYGLRKVSSIELLNQNKSLRKIGKIF
jgi:hypothetical protein